jgi:hypothetical protein
LDEYKGPITRSKRKKICILRSGNHILGTSPNMAEKMNNHSEYLPQTSTTISSKSIPVEIEPGKTLNINPNLTVVERQQLMKLLFEHKEAFAWDYTDMKGISPELCTHRIYIKEYFD